MRSWLSTLGHPPSGTAGSAAETPAKGTFMTARTAGVLIAVAAILVQAPRLVLALLAADRLPVGPGAERALLVLAGIGTALVLTGGNLFLAHTVAHVERWRRALTATWLAVLVCSGALIIPVIVAGLRARTLPDVLGPGRLEWTWAVLAALAHEATAAGCVLASAAWAGAGAAGSAEPVSPPGSAPALRSAPLPAQLPAEPGIPCRAGCGRLFATGQGEIAHLRHCRLRRERHIPPS
jgi:hypothetical protein